MRAIDFLEEVYDGAEGWIDLPSKANSNWSQWLQRWPDRRKAEIRIKGSLEDEENLYFSVITFSEKGRNILDAQAAHWLWADLDLVTPAACTKASLAPTMCWESSPGRYQAMWKLTEELAPAKLAKFNRMLTYALDADHGGWDLTQVLRIPGTRNYKYHGSPRVKLLFDNGPVYKPRVILKRLRKLVPMAVERRELTYRSNPKWTMPPTARRLLRTPPELVVEGERSEQLWKLECSLVEAEVPEEEIFRLVWKCAWNKYEDVNTGREQLRREIARAIKHVMNKDDYSTLPPRENTPEEDEEERELVVKRSLNPIPFSRFMAQPYDPPRWLVDRIWTAKSHGIIGGEPKTSKSTLALALALSVASGRPFLGHFPVRATGPVLIVQEENSDEFVQDRLARIAASYGLMPEVKGRGNGSVMLEMPDTEVPAHVSNHPGLDLTDEDCREMLESDIQGLQPIMVILDPLYLMLGEKDENKSADLRDTLKWLLRLRFDYGVAICLIHHMRKAPTGKEASAVRAGQRLLGSTTLHGWAESSLYIEAMESTDLDPTALKLHVQPETRNMAPRNALEIILRVGEGDNLDFSAEVTGVTRAMELKEAVGRGNTLNHVAELLGVQKVTARKRLEAAGYVFFQKSQNSATRVFPPGSNGRSG